MKFEFIRSTKKMKETLETANSQIGWKVLKSAHLLDTVIIKEDFIKNQIIEHINIFEATNIKRDISSTRLLYRNIQKKSTNFEIWNDKISNRPNLLLLIYFGKN